eukprot:3387760-Pleurochrysis_carterae.AAC.1
MPLATDFRSTFGLWGQWVMGELGARYLWTAVPEWYVLARFLKAVWRCFWADSQDGACCDRRLEMQCKSDHGKSDSLCASVPVACDQVFAAFARRSVLLWCA